MKVFQIGAAGGIGRRLTQLLATRGDTVTGMHRGPAQGDTISEAGGTPVTGDLIADSTETLAEKLRGHDAVVFSAKKTADVYLTRTGLDWVIIRPGTLLDTPGTGQVTAGPAVEYGDVHRDDVAAFIDAALHTPALSRTIVELTSGSTPVAEAVSALAS